MDELLELVKKYPHLEFHFRFNKHLDSVDIHISTHLGMLLRICHRVVVPWVLVERTRPKDVGLLIRIEEAIEEIERSKNELPG